MEEESKNEGVWLQGLVTPDPKCSQEWETTADFPNYTQPQEPADERGLHQEKDWPPCSGPTGKESNEKDNIDLSSQPSTPPHSTKKRCRCRDETDSSKKRCRCRDETDSSKKVPRPKPKIHRPKVVVDFGVKEKMPKKAKTPKAKTPKGSSSTTSPPKPLTPTQGPPRKKRRDSVKNEGALVQNEEDAAKRSTKEVAEENPECVEKTCRRSLNFDMESQKEDSPKTIFQYECRNEEGAAISIANEVVAQESLCCVEMSTMGSLDFDPEHQVKRELPKVIHKYQRRKKRWALAYDLVESKFLLEILRLNFPKAYKKSRRNRKRARTSLQAVSPTKYQISAALIDPESFGCVISLYALRKSKTRTSTPRRRRIAYLDANPNPNRLPNRRRCLAYPDLNQLPVENLNKGMGWTKNCKPQICNLNQLPVENLNKGMGWTKNCEPQACKNCELQACMEVQSEVEEAYPYINSEPKACVEVHSKGKENMVEPTIDINREPEDCMEVHSEGEENMVQPAVDNAVFPESLRNEIQWVSPQFEDVLHKSKTGSPQVPKAALDQGLLRKLLINALSQRLEFLCISERNQAVVQDRDPLDSVVPYKPKKGRSRKNNKSMAKADECNHQILVPDPNSGDLRIVSYRGKNDKKDKPKGKVDLDAESMRVWKLWMENDGSGENEEVDEEKAKWWEEERKKYLIWLDPFVDRMRITLGDRTFSPWKGSVVYSVVGAYLTQNVSDHLSSSTVMAFAARFPRRSAYKQIEYEEKVEKGCSPESVGSSESPADVHVQIPPPAETDFIEGIYTHEDDNKLSRKESPVDRNIVSTEMENRDDKVVLEEAVPSCSNRRVGEKETLEPKSGPGRKKGKVKAKQQQTPIDWDDLRKKYWTGRKSDDSANTMDPIDWDAVRQASIEEVAEIILERGMNYIIATRIKEFLDRMVRDHGSTDLEWLRDVPPDKAKHFLLSIKGLGLKSVECIRLLTLHQVAFPVDTNVGRVAVRLGWAPLQPLPDEVQMHELKVYPWYDTVQKYLWPRLCKFEQPTLYELHYQLITFGKVFCTKINPNCNECPMKTGCKHYASAHARDNLSLPAPEEKSTAGPDEIRCPTPIMSLPNLDIPNMRYRTQTFEPIVEEPPSPPPEDIERLLRDIEDFPEPLAVERDIEDFAYEDGDEMPMVSLNTERVMENSPSFINGNNIFPRGGEISHAIIVLDEEAAKIPLPRMKNVSRLRTVHSVYELPDIHPLLAMLDLDPRDSQDPCPYLLAIWTKGETEQPENQCNSQEPGTCNEIICCSSSNTEETVPGTILIPCRTANRGIFPLNGTYFQVNELFADHESSQVPIEVPRAWLWSLYKRDLYCGTSATSIFRGLSMAEIRDSFWKGFICVRGFDRKTHAPRPLARRFHMRSVSMAKAKANAARKPNTKNEDAE